MEAMNWRGEGQAQVAAGRGELSRGRFQIMLMVSTKVRVMTDQLELHV